MNQVAQYPVEIYPTLITSMLNGGRLLESSILIVREAVALGTVQADAMALAIAGAIKRVGPFDVSGWKLLCSLVNSAECYHPDVKDAFLLRFTEAHPCFVESRIQVFRTLVNLGHHFNRKELLAELNLKEKYHSDWISQWKSQILQNKSR